jgi:hypothetical protein
VTTVTTAATPSTLTTHETAPVAVDIKGVTKAFRGAGH